LGGAALATLVLRANTSGQTIRGLQHKIDTLQKREMKLLSKCVQLEDELAQAKLELKLERQNKFATGKDKEKDAPEEPVSEDPPPTEEPKKPWCDSRASWLVSTDPDAVRLAD
jgi:hypothetical protein